MAAWYPDGHSAPAAASPPSGCGQISRLDEGSFSLLLSLSHGGLQLAALWGGQFADGLWQELGDPQVGLETLPLSVGTQPGAKPGTEPMEGLVIL